MREPGDYLSPILVKELRQGLRAKVFTMAFLLLQGVMIIAISLGMSFANARGDEAAFFQGFFWAMIGLPVIVILPFSGMGTVRAERTANTLELMYLTRLTAFRILAGKWLAITVQALLLACAVLPYVVLRYFLGGVELWQDLAALGILMLCSAVVTAFTVGFSAFTSQFPRWILIVLGLFLIQTVPMLLVAVAFGMGGAPSALPGGAIVFLAAAGVLVVVLLLQIGSSRIAPPAENHSTPVRGIALAVLGLAAILGPRSTPVAWASLLIALPVCVLALCEPVPAVPSLYRTFTRRGVAGRFAGRFLYPGWPSGFAFSLLVLALIGLLFIPADEIVENALTVTAFAGAVYVPMAILRLGFPRVKKVFTVYFVIQMVSAVPAYLYGIAQAADLDEIEGIAGLLLPLFPTSVLLISADGGSAVDRLALGGAVAPILGAVTILGVVGLGAAARRGWGAIRSMEKAALATAPPGKA